MKRICPICGERFSGDSETCPACERDKEARDALSRELLRTAAVPGVRPVKDKPEEEYQPAYAGKTGPGLRGKGNASGSLPVRSPSSSCHTINLELGQPIVEEAMQRMRLEMARARADHIRLVKLIHGYGSTGKGGAIRLAVRAELRAMKLQRQIAAWIPGEDFDGWNSDVNLIAGRLPILRKDMDYGRRNRGITIVEL